MEHRDPFGGTVDVPPTKASRSSAWGMFQLRLNICRRPGSTARTFLVAVICLAVASCAAPAVLTQSDTSDSPPPLFSTAGQFVVDVPAVAPGPNGFVDAQGRAADLSRFKGRVVLLNFWAAWCEACAEEMPSLDALAGQMSGTDLAVVPISVDRRNASIAKAFYEQHNISNLPFYVDQDMRTAYFPSENPHDAPFALRSLPRTFLLDRQGKIRGSVVGEVDWSSDAARALLAYYLTGSGAARR